MKTTQNSKNDLSLCFYCKVDKSIPSLNGGGHAICNDCYTNGYDPREFVEDDN